MIRTILSLALTARLLCVAPTSPQPSTLTLDASAQAVSVPMWWSLIDPELSLWFARVPEDTAPERDQRVLWDWSWRGFLAALFGQPLVQGDAAHA